MLAVLQSCFLRLRYPPRFCQSVGAGAGPLLPLDSRIPHESPSLESKSLGNETFFSPVNLIYVLAVGIHARLNFLMKFIPRCPLYPERSPGTFCRRYFGSLRRILMTLR